MEQRQRTQKRGESSFNVEKSRLDFPMLRRSVHGKQLVYLDNAATTQKPTQVLDRMDRFYREEYATVRRGVYGLSQEATEYCHETRKRCQTFLNASSADEIIFTKGTTEAINLLATSYGEKFLHEKDEVLVATTEHHSNIVPWQRLCEKKRAQLRVIPVNDQGEILLEEFKKLLNAQTKIVSVAHVSNALGIIHPIEEITKLAHRAGAVVVIDGAQAAAHLPIDVQRIDCDFYAFSGHKTFGPTGIGVLYGKQKWLESMDPYQGGGDMISSVTFEKITYAPPPAKFEAGTPAIAEIIGLGAALEYLEQFSFDALHAHEQRLLQAATEAIASSGKIKIIGNGQTKVGIISFVMEGIHPHDIGTILDQEGVAVRAGHHCAQPTMDRFGIPATTRISFALYNTFDDVEKLLEGMNQVKKVFGI
ncbi:MAG: cysteine sulfinate desulfinase [Deltaproteobacteria bacterium RIFCSPLOWO2_02_FULL_44_10]|nr:MAG: cysteine sulfinate desulfinase [Deltaproteobacteria bacterium RIFCSPHIGHO2_02_FULL_44_16]OGQ45048.1 MAG: cysteine sulfinate desulfinase [Deltaproteobacteria bacterium RIFCSPLOWO2_02_FULL_44_10]